MTSLKNFQELIVWQKSMDLVKQIYQHTSSFPKEEIFGLTSQMRRAAVSIPANIAEGQARNTRGEFCQFLGIAKGSLAELQTLILLSTNLNYLTQENSSSLLMNCEEVAKMLNGLLEISFTKELTTNHYPLTTKNYPLTTKNYALITIKGLDIYDPIKDEVKARNLHDIAYWMVDDDYDDSNFVVKQVFFCGGDKTEFGKWKKGLENIAKDSTKKKVEKTLKIEIDDEAFDRLYGHISHPIEVKKKGQKIAVRIISQFGEECTKILRID
ncbi:MAG: four helix bundle protein [Sphingobacteriales bacterium]|nr:four helix bundle protein [Sphingobacteriales bacterium]